MGARGAGVPVLAGVALGGGVGLTVGELGGGVGAAVGVVGLGVGWQAVAKTSSAIMSRAARTEAYALSRFRNAAIRWYSTLRCSGSDGSRRSWLIRRVCSSIQACQQSGHVRSTTIGPHLPGSGACASAGLCSPQRRHTISAISWILASPQLAGGDCRGEPPGAPELGERESAGQIGDNSRVTTQVMAITNVSLTS